MFNPTQDDVRRFFCDVYRKTTERQVMTPLEHIASDWLVQHPEYESQLQDVNAALEAQYSVENGKTNPFLHLSMHLSIAEQISINQPIGIQPAFVELANKLQYEHEAHHIIMDCLGAMIWEAQRHNTPFDGAAYVNAVKKAAQQI